MKLVSEDKSGPQSLGDWYILLMDLNKRSTDIECWQLIIDYIFSTPRLKSNESIVTCLQGHSLSDMRTWMATPGLMVPIVEALPKGLVSRYLPFFNLSHPQVSAAIFKRLAEPLEPNVNYAHYYGTDIEAGRNDEFYQLAKSLAPEGRAAMPKNVATRLYAYMLAHPSKSMREEAIRWMGETRAQVQAAP